MALMKAALAWERFVLKDVTRFAALAKVPENNIEILRSDQIRESFLRWSWSPLPMWVVC